MLRLFSSVRKTLINEGKTSRYLRYAVGEVLLIMVGILLALQVQTWNQNRLLAQDRRELIESFKADFRSNLDRLDEVLARVEEYVEGLDTFLAVVADDASELPVEELRALARNAFRSTDFLPALSTYKTALSTGSYGLLEDSKLKELLIGFEEHYAEFETISEINTEMHFNGQVSELRQELGSLAYLSIGARPTPKAFVISDEEYHNLISRKDVYAMFDSKRGLRSRQRGDLRSMKEISEQILTALEELD